MPLVESRNQRLGEVINKLKEVEGINEAWHDDYDSIGVHVFFTVQARRSWKSISKVTWDIEHKKATTKQAVREILISECIPFAFLAEPQIVYEDVNRLPCEPRRRINVGYDTTVYKLLVEV